MTASSTPPIITRRLSIHGKVQGVYYRASAQTEGTRLHLRGWVRNRHDGSVEALVSGPAPVVEEFITWARNGPPAARVDRIDISDAEPPAAESFAVRPSA
jgi:acylphosphatase